MKTWHYVAISLTLGLIVGYAACDQLYTAGIPPFKQLGDKIAPSA